MSRTKRPYQESRYVNDVSAYRAYKQCEMGCGDEWDAGLSGGGPDNTDTRLIREPGVLGVLGVLGDVA